MSETIIGEKDGHDIIVVVESMVTFVARKQGVNGAEPTDTKIGAVQIRGGGMIGKGVWKDAAEKERRGSTVKGLLVTTMDRMPDNIVAALGKVGQMAYDGELPSNLVIPNAQAMAAVGDLKKGRPS